MEITILKPEQAAGFLGLTIDRYKQYLLCCSLENILAVGCLEDGSPCGLALAVTDRQRHLQMWQLLSFFVSETHRGRGAGRALRDALFEALRGRHCRRLDFQAVLRPEKGDALCGFLKKGAQGSWERIAEVYRFDREHILKSPFARGAMAGVFIPEKPFRLVSWEELDESYREELRKNEGGWYPQFVSPLIGSQSFNKTCTTFALDEEENKLAGWITVLDVNGGRDLLYRTFFTREAYRGTQIGFHLFTEAVKNHLTHYMNRGGLSSIPLDNERALRFSRLFFKGACSHISYEYKMELSLLEDERFVMAWENAAEKQFPMFPGIDLASYETLTATLCETGAGRLPVLHVRDRQEFEDMICRIFYKGVKRTLPASMGAMMIKGWRDMTGTAHRVILLSDGYYSNVSPEEIGLPPDVWKDKSRLIRMAHESAHYYTLRAHGFMNNGLRDEFIADAMGIIDAFGAYRADYFLLFMGLENPAQYRRGGRLENYLPKGMKEETPDWEQSEIFTEMKRDAVRLAQWLQAYLEKNPQFLDTQQGKLQLLDLLCEKTSVMPPDNLL